MKNHYTTITGYAYIDEVIEKIKKNLPENEQQNFETLCKNIHSAGKSEGYIKLKEEQLQKDSL
jgi:hypothetical protein